eukprot:scaffold2071_cov56-Phaeocystis_antarctica.AAC.10
MMISSPSSYLTLLRPWVKGTRAGTCTAFPESTRLRLAQDPLHIIGRWRAALLGGRCCTS